MENINSAVTMKELPISERPYEKCEREGAQSLSDAELLAILIQSGTRKETAVDLARKLLMQNPEKNLLGLARMDFGRLTAVSGIGRVKALKLLAAFELMKRVSREGFGEKPVLKSPASIAEYYMQRLRFLNVEEVHAAFFNTKCIFLGEKRLSVGTVNSSVVSPREIFIEALLREAVGVILVHNHPSGDPTASREDIHLTVQVSQAGRMLDIRLLDHIIIGDNRYFSFKESGCSPF